MTLVDTSRHFQSILSRVCPPNLLLLYTGKVRGCMMWPASRFHFFSENLLGHFLTAHPNLHLRFWKPTCFSLLFPPRPHHFFNFKLLLCCPWNSLSTKPKGTLLSGPMYLFPSPSWPHQAINFFAPPKKKLCFLHIQYSSLAHKKLNIKVQTLTPPLTHLEGKKWKKKKISSIHEPQWKKLYEN